MLSGLIFAVGVDELLTRLRKLLIFAFVEAMVKA